MKKFSSLAFSAVLAATLVFPATAGAQSSYKDISDDFWAKDAIDNLSEQGIINGYKDNTFRPNAPVKRSQAALMLTDALDLETSERPNPGFSDVDADDAIYEAVAAVADEGILEGKNDKFMPNDELTRAQMAKILTVAYELEGEADEDFADIDEDYWAYEYIEALAANGIASGYDKDNTFRPSESTKRAQFAVFLKNSVEVEAPEAPEIEVDEEIVEVLNDTMEAQLGLDTYAFDGTVGLTMDMPLPDELSDEEKEMLQESMNMEMALRGAYQKDPLLSEAVMEQTIPGFDETITSAAIATADKQYQYVTDAAFMGYPEDWQGKYIEFDYDEMFGEDFSNMFDVEEQQEMTEELYDLFIEHLGTDNFELLETHTAIPEDVEYEKVLKFELEEEDIAAIADIFEEDILPELESMLENPSISALGLSQQKVAILEDKAAEEDFDEFLENLSLDNFVIYQAIDADNHIVFDTGDIAISYTDEEGSLSVGIDYAMNMGNFNEDVTWEYGLPENEEDIIPFEEVMEWQEQQLEDLEGFEEIEEEDVVEEDEEVSDEEDDEDAVEEDAAA
ncbi:S-layer homology domain-containing protein [Bacillus piscicola]|uniref:S-layer homology domain-containing protein n=1 Tax=Bacillus piscicola TaxID=1632684 RepID=UPI001F08DC50|nr:S-layer homology domain-containing protein [Bacillus piscicola]